MGWFTSPLVDFDFTDEDIDEISKVAEQGRRDPNFQYSPYFKEFCKKYNKIILCENPSLRVKLTLKFIYDSVDEKIKLENEKMERKIKDRVRERILGKK